MDPFNPFPQQVPTSVLLAPNTLEGDTAALGGAPEAQALGQGPARASAPHRVNPTRSLFAVPEPLPNPLAGLEQFRLARMQSFNWGTFSGVTDFAIPHEGYLFVGKSGSGKSTMLDAHSALLTPPRWVDFNVAARSSERHGKDRNVLTYVRGAWSQQTNEAGEHVFQYLRMGTTWSALAETYRNGAGKVVTLAQVLWLRGNSTAMGELRRMYLVFEREFEVREFQFFVEKDFDVRSLKVGLPDAFIKEEFSGYQERFRRLLGIESERALRLLHKTQSAKDLGDLNVFLRDFMLDPPETFETAERLVEEFRDLNEAHAAVVSARRQIETLKPAQAAWGERQQAQSDLTALLDEESALEPHREQKRKGFLDTAINNLRVAIQGAQSEIVALKEREWDESEKLRHLRNKRDGAGGSILAELQEKLEAAQNKRPERLAKKALADAACKALGLAPVGSSDLLAQAIAQARERLDGADQVQLTLEKRLFDIKTEQGTVEERFKFLSTEIRAMERQPSNIPARLLAVRQGLAEAIGVPEDKLPFAGELLQVKPEESAWAGAIERVVGDLGKSLLVEDKYYAAVSSQLNSHNIGERLVYLRTLPHASGAPASGPNSVVRKLDIARGTHQEWLREELKARYDFECVESVAELSRNTLTRGVTREGLLKRSRTLHEKNDRRRVDDRSQWVLGFDNSAKMALYTTEAQALALRLTGFAAKLTDARSESSQQQSQLLQANTLVNMTWEELDLDSLLRQINDLEQRLRQETEARPELEELTTQIENQERFYNLAVKARQDKEGFERDSLKDMTRLTERLSGLSQDLLEVPLASERQAQLDGRYRLTGKVLGLDTLDQATTQVVQALSRERSHLAERMSQLKALIERHFTDYRREWPAEADGLDATLASSEDFFAKLTRLEEDGLPRFEDRFMNLLQEQSNQNLLALQDRLERERNAISERLEQVNESLATAEYSPGTHLVIVAKDKTLADVRQFRQSLRDTLSHTLFADREQAEKRFEALNALVRRLSSQESADLKWRTLVLDVRQHVDFMARELNVDNIEVEAYRSGEGKSGGQRQKLAATCLAAALQYQLGGQDRSLPAFSTVVLDEAFDRADAEFTALAMNIFKTFGFQMIVATPFKSVMTLEPFIGGASVIDIKDRNRSVALQIEYDNSTRTLLLPEDTKREVAQAARAAALEAARAAKLPKALTNDADFDEAQESAAS